MSENTKENLFWGFISIVTIFVIFCAYLNVSHAQIKTATSTPHMTTFSSFQLLFLTDGVGCLPTTFKEDFESYTIDSSLDNGSGGTGWADSWALSGQGTAIADGVSPFMGDVSAKLTGTSGDGPALARSFNANYSCGSLYFALKVDAFNANGGGSLEMYDNGSWVTSFQSFTPNNIKYYAGGWVTFATGLSTDTWYLINVEWDNSLHPNLMRARLKTGDTWGSWTDWFSPGSFSSISGIKLINSITNRTPNASFDEISGRDPTEIPPPPTPGPTPPSDYTVETATIWAVSTLFFTMGTVIAYFIVAFAIFFVISWGLGKFIRPIIRLLR